jgi:hypothetical protein
MYEYNFYKDVKQIYNEDYSLFNVIITRIGLILNIIALIGNQLVLIMKTDPSIFNIIFVISSSIYLLIMLNTYT